MTEGLQNQKTERISGQRFDTPLYVQGGITGEPERYLAEKPFELSKYEFSILKKGKFRSDSLFQLVCGATIGLVLLILGKAINALIQKQTPSLENYELWSVGAGIIIALILKIRKQTPEEKEFKKVRDYIDKHYKETQDSCKMNGFGGVEQN